MADNITVSGGSYSGVIASRDLGSGVQAQRIVLVGHNGTSWVDVPYQDAVNGGGLRVFNMADQAIQGIYDEGTDVQAAPVPVGGRATSAFAAFTELTDGKTSHAGLTLDRKLVTMPFGARNDMWNSRPVSSTDTGDHTLISAAASPVRRIPLSIRVSNRSATPTDVLIKDGTGGTVIDRIPAPAYGGTAVWYPAGLWDTTAATLLAFACVDAVTTVYVSATGFNAR